MKSMRLYQYKPAEEKPLILSEVPLPEPRRNQVRLKVRVCGVCHTDLHTVEGDIHSPHLPIIPGHQVVGIVEALGAQVAEKLSIGMRVGVPWLHHACGKCEFCRRGEENLCRQAKFTGFHLDGGFAEAMLAEADFVLPLPEEVTDIQAAPLLCVGIIGYRSLVRAGVSGGERLGLFGFGASAHLAIQLARHWNCEIYVFTRSPQHKKHAEELGAAWVGDATDKPPQSLDRAVIFAPAGHLVPLALEKVRPGGTVAINAIHMSDIPSLPYKLIYGERTLRSVANATYEDGVAFLRLAAEIGIRATTVKYPLWEANQALVYLKHSAINGEAVLVISARDDR